MAYRKVETRIWNDEKFRELPDDGKFAFLFLLTHPHMTSIGAMRATIAGLAAELGWTPERLREGLREPFRVGMAVHNERACFIALPKFVKHNPPGNPNVVVSWAKLDELIPECPEKTEHYLVVEAYLKGLGEAFRKALPKELERVAQIRNTNTSRNSNTNTEQEAEQQTRNETGETEPSAADAAPPPPEVDPVKTPDPPPPRAAPDPTPPQQDPAAVAELIRNHPWLGKTLDPDLQARLLIDGWPELDVAAHVRKAIAKLTPDEIERRSGANGKRGGPSGYLTAFLDIADKDRIVTAAKAAAQASPDGKSGADRLLESIQRASS